MIAYDTHIELWLLHIKRGTFTAQQKGDAIANRLFALMEKRQNDWPLPRSVCRSHKYVGRNCEEWIG